MEGDVLATPGPNSHDEGSDEDGGESGGLD